MHESNIEKNPPHEKSQSASHSTGPTSPDGKSKSSMNRLTHGCRSDKTVLPFEDPAEFEFTVQSWMTSYDPQDPTASTLVFETARAQWIFQRNQQRLDETESALPPDAIQWTDDHFKRYNNFLRYKTTAERSFYRAFNNLEAHYKRQADKAAAIEKARAQMAKIQIRWINEKAAVAAKYQLVARQWVEVFTNDSGECVTTFAPTNEKLAEQLATRGEFVTRVVSFLNGVPPAYDWLHPNHLQRCQPCMGIQQFTTEGWRRQIEIEKLSAPLQPYPTPLLSEP
jgi:hypothetical protein